MTLRGWLGDRTRAPWTAICKSLWHGPDKDGRFEVAWLTAAPPSAGKKPQQVFALRGPDVTSDLQVLEFINATDWGSTADQLLRELSAPRANCNPIPPVGNADDYSRGGTSATDIDAAVARLAEEHIQRFGLNPEQAEVANHVAGWIGSASRHASADAAGATAALSLPAPDDASAVCLVHGPFGTGGVNSDLGIPNMQNIDNAFKCWYVSLVQYSWLQRVTNFGMQETLNTGASKVSLLTSKGCIQVRHHTSIVTVT